MKKVLLLLAVASMIAVAAPLGTAGPKDGPSSAAAPAAGSAAATAAAALYGSNTLVLHDATDPSLASAFPTLVFYYVIDGDGLPGKTHTMAWDPVQEKAYDASKDFNTLLTLTAVVMTSSADAIRYSKAYAVAANAELQLVREAVGSADSQRLGRTVPDPVATAVIGGWDVTVSTWSFQNGVYAAWTVNIRTSRVSQAIWTVQDIGVGPRALSIGSAAFRNGVRITDSYGPGLSVSAELQTGQGTQSLVLPGGDEDLVPFPGASATNFDGSRWQVYYPRARLGTALETADRPWAEALARAGKAAYDIQVRTNPDRNGACTTDPLTQHATNQNANNWGFDAKEADCELRVDLIAGLNSIGAPASAPPPTLADFQTKVVVHVAAREVLFAIGYYRNPVVHTADGIAKVLVGHEHFHFLQFAMGMCTQPYKPLYCADPWASILEGMARFSETLLAPVESHDPTSLWWGTQDSATAGNGVNYFQLHPSTSTCVRDFWPGTPLQVIVRDTYGEHYADYGLYWGFLYARNGHLPTLRDIVARTVARNYDPANPTQGRLTRVNCNAEVGQAITDALVAAGGSDSSHAAALAEFGLAMWTRDFQWAAPGGSSYQWGQYLEPVKLETYTLGSEEPHEVLASGLQFAQLPTAGSYDVTYRTTGTDTPGSWRARIAFQNLDGTIQPNNIIELSPGQTVTVNTTNWLAVFVEMVRSDGSPGTYLLKVANAA